MNRYSISSIIRSIGIIKIADKFRFYWFYLKTYQLRQQFDTNNQGVKLPPAFYIYETFGLDYIEYYNKSIDTSKWLISFFQKYKELKNIRIMDWGCGSGRIIRHLPGLLEDSCMLYGTDYNKKYIFWCNENIPNIIFKTNRLSPPLDFVDGYFDIIYGISIFTHLSEEMHYKWFNELIRVTKPGGIILLTLSGEAFKLKMTDSEKIQFNNGSLISRSNTKEGHRTFTTFHPPTFVQGLIGNNEILEHVPGNIKNGKPQQDIWIIKKV